MAEGTPRTWTLSEKPDSHLRWTRLKRENECSFSDEILIEVIEKEPVLDLLERAYLGKYNLGAGLEIEAFLRTHGRLKGASDEADG